MKYIVDVNGERITVELDGARAVIDGEVLDVGLTALEGTPVRLVRVGEQVHRVVARRGSARGAWTLDVDGVRVAAEALDQRQRAIRDLTAEAEAASGPAPLIAPMPGLVVRVAVAVGDTVAAGQGLVVVEAMKMETTLAAEIAGTVSAVHVAAGAMVDAGALLVEVAPAA